MKRFAIIFAVVLFAATAAFSNPDKKLPVPEYKIKPGEPMIDFELKDTAGNVVKTADFRKDKIFIFRFTSSTHKFADMQVAQFRKLIAKYDQKIAVLDIAVKEPKKGAALDAYYKGQDKCWPSVLDDDGAITDKYGATVPSVIVVNKDGKIMGIGQFIPFFQFDPFINAILEANEAAENK